MFSKKVPVVFLIALFSFVQPLAARDVVVRGSDGKPTAVSSNGWTGNEMGTVREPAINDYRILIDDFEDGTLQNRLGGDSGAWNLDPNEEYTSCYPEIVSQPAPELSEKVLKLTYDVNGPEPAENGYWMKLRDVDASNYTHLEFFVKGDAKKKFTTSFIVELKKYKNDKRIEKLAGSYRVMGVTSTWQRISIPLSKFSAIDGYRAADPDWSGWKNLDEFVIIFNERFSDVKEGVLYFDNIQIVKEPDRLPHCYDFRGSHIRKTYNDYTAIEWAQWIAARLQGKPEEVLVKKEFPADDRAFLEEIARDTWGFFDNIVDKNSHLPLDTICLTQDGVFGDGGYFGDYTNVTNVGLYLMCLVAGYDFGFISKEEAIRRIKDTLGTVERLETYKNFLFNYYDTTTMERTSNFVSLVDSGWLTIGVYVVKNAFPEVLKEQCDRLLANWDFSFFYDPVQEQFFHGYYTNIAAYANYHYGTFYTEPRVISYCAIARDDVPIEHWFRLDRTLPDNYTWQTQVPKNRQKKVVHGISYYGGYYEYNGEKYVPSWGGSLFEALMPSLVLQEKELSPDSLGFNDKQHVDIHIEYALNKLGYQVWGMSPCSVPEGGYSEFGVPVLGLKGYDPGVVTPHATFLALEYEPAAAIANLRKMLELYDIYGEYGFYDAVDPDTGLVALKYLCLDQAMSFIALDNYLNNGAIRKRFAADPDMKKGEFLLTEEDLFD